MTIGIIGAMDEEIALLQKQIKNQTIETVANTMYIKGTLETKDVVLVKSGIGKVNAAMTTAILMEKYQPTFVINTGSAGGFSEALKVGDVVISDAVVHHDVDVTAFDYVHGQVPQMPATFKADKTLVRQVRIILKEMEIGSEIGLIATGDSFMNDQTKVQTIRELFPTMIACEMEAAAIAQVCYQYNVPFVVIRALSDIAGQEAPMSFQQFLEVAATNAANLIIEFVKRV
ncbi:MAG TPA: 5'-methylthioadenosine/adenosylhomocysteine nucleosidase [Candidatus Pseudogracilibacillus intestinigallinarum]|uniref:5'-methylthioadenosine/S-adenosylhomocysteine nucleosidase n=1 Tax=Candidatus Pseudogracilibacillus intestinigallinarum TaxID=2838742 RepID=A0A9D1TJ37_9BACI|nr:5'-methylthioadenosine/adenosylhomocysteine nucleosidase [Candidatus Pseudogracilibacillus intestinigallinarum]